jgi:hypothetical protein
VPTQMNRMSVFATAPAASASKRKRLELEARSISSRSPGSKKGAHAPLKTVDLLLVFVDRGLSCSREQSHVASADDSNPHKPLP